MIAQEIALGGKRQQGIRILLGENFEEIVSFANGSFPSGSITGLGAFLSAQEVECQTVQDSQVVLRMAVTRATVVLIHCGLLESDSS